MTRTEVPAYTLPLRNGQTLRIYSRRSFHVAAAKFLTEAARIRREAVTASEVERRLSIGNFPVE
jgi:hypothetical protein